MRKMPDTDLPLPEVKLWLIFCNLAELVRQAELDSGGSWMEGGPRSCCKSPSSDPYFPSDTDLCPIWRSATAEGYSRVAVTSGSPIKDKCHNSAVGEGMPCRAGGGKVSVAMAAVGLLVLGSFKGGDA